MRGRARLRRLEQQNLRVAGSPIRVHRLTAVAHDAADRPDLPTFALVHGLGVSSGYLVPLAESLARFGSVAVFDLPGFGGVPHPRRPLRIETFARVMRGACERLGIARPVLVGHSMGAQLAVEAMAADPEFSDAAVLVAPVVPCELRSLPPLARAFVRSIRHERPRAAMASVAGYLQGGLRWPLEILPAMVNYPIERRIASITGDLTIMGGTYDLTSPEEWRDQLAAAATAARSVRVVTVTGAAHQVVIDHAARVAEEALALAGVAGPA